MTDKEHQELSADEVLKKYDKESNKRIFNGVLLYFINGLCIIFALFQLYTAMFGILDAHLQRAVHLAFGAALIFLLFPGKNLGH